MKITNVGWKTKINHISSEIPYSNSKFDFILSNMPQYGFGSSDYEDMLQHIRAWQLLW